MTFEKVLQAMKEGKKVKRKAWDFNYEGYCTNQDLLADDWEIVGEEQPKLNCDMEVSLNFKGGKRKMKFEQALQAMREGLKVRVWDRCYPKYFYIKDGMRIYAALGDKPDEIVDVLDINFILSSNWVVYAPIEETDRKTNHLEKAFEECADKLKQEAVKMIADNSKEPVKEKNPYYTYNTDIGKGKYKIVFETDDRNGYRQLEEYIRENFIDKKVTQAHSSYGFSSFGKCLKCGNAYTCTSENPLRYCMACGVEIKTNWS